MGSIGTFFEPHIWGILLLSKSILHGIYWHQFWATFWDDLQRTQCYPHDVYYIAEFDPILGHFTWEIIGIFLGLLTQGVVFRCLATAK